MHKNVRRRGAAAPLPTGVADGGGRTGGGDVAFLDDRELWAPEFKTAFYSLMLAQLLSAVFGNVDGG